MKAGIATLMLLVSEAASREIIVNNVKVETTDSMMLNNIRLWFLILFVVVAVAMAWKISVDNEPDTSKDSILYAKFLTNKVEKAKID